MTSEQMVQIAYKALDDKKAQDIKIIDISGISVIADYFIIADASNKPQIQAMVKNVEDELGKNKIHPRQVEGVNGANWILMDYKDIIIHIFNTEDRLFYDLERIWRDGKIIDIADIKTES